MKLVLVGYMGSGKSAVGRLLSSKLGCKFIDLDDFIEEKEGQSISEIFSKKGEIYFRKKEMEYLNKLLNSENQFVLSLGGGTPCYGQNMELITTKSQSIYLKTSLNTLFERLSNEKSQRPLIASLEVEQLKEFLAKHLFERAPFYEKSNLSVGTDGKSIQEVVNEIENVLV